MARHRRHIFPLLRLLVTLLVASCLSPGPQAPSRKPASVAALPDAPSYAHRIVIRKSDYTLTLYRGDRPVKTYRAAFGRGYLDGDKRVQGDKRTPEGDFYICTKNRSRRFYKFLGLSYPELRHAEYGVQSGMISLPEYHRIKEAVAERQPPPWDTRLGGAVGIHGRTDDGTGGGSWVSANWTDGCIAMNNADVDEIYSAVSLGTPVTILP